MYYAGEQLYIVNKLIEQTIFDYIQSTRYINTLITLRLGTSGASNFSLSLWCRNKLYFYFKWLDDHWRI